MFPSRGDLHVAPFNDETLYMEQFNKANFWYFTLILSFKDHKIQQPFYMTGISRASTE